jgi:hypothetical protein
METNANETQPAAPEEKLTRRNGDYNTAAIKRQALLVSQKVRAGKFERVSSEFINNIEAAIEAKIRSFKLEVSSPLGQVDPPEGEDFLTGAGKKKLIEAFTTWIAREIHRQSNNVRVGKTL